MINLREYYELCKTIDPKLFYYPAFVKEETECGTVGCLWGNAPKLLPDKIFKFVKNQSTRLISTKEFADKFDKRTIIVNTKEYMNQNQEAIFDYFKPVDLEEQEILNFIFCGDGLYLPKLEIDVLSLSTLDNTMYLTFEQALERFKLGLEILDKLHVINTTSTI